METVIQFIILGIGAGAAYALLGQGLVVVHRSTGVVNFAHGGIAVLAAFFFIELKSDSLPTPLAMVVTLAAAIVFGVLMYLVAVRPLLNASALARATATLAVLIIIQAAGTLIWGDATKVAPTFLPSNSWHLGSTINVPVSRVVLLVIALIVTAVLWLGFRYTLRGLATSALSENQRSTAALGWSPDLLAAGTWALGAALAAVAGILLAPLTGASVSSMTTLVIVGLAAALLGRLTSFPLTLLGSLGVGIAQSLAGNYISQQGVATSVPFFIILIILVFQGRKIPLPTAAVERFSKLGSGRVRLPLVIASLIGFAVLTLGLFSDRLLGATAATVGFSVVLLSIVVLSGYAGQLSLAQFAFAGIGALIAGRLVSSAGLPFWLALVAGVLAAAPIGAIFGLIALRVRGVTLAILTLGLGAAVTAIVFEYSPITGHSQTGGTPVGPQTLFGLHIDATSHPDRYALFCGVMFMFAALAVANLRRSRAGRRLVAVRVNERAAAALGINVYGAKLYAFAFASSMAALGGILLGFQYNTILYRGVFEPFQSILAVAFAVVGGLGYVGGALTGGTFIPGGVGPFVLQELIPGSEKYISLIGGVLLLVLLITHPDGLAEGTLKSLRAIGRLLQLGRFGKAGEPKKSEAASAATALSGGDGAIEARNPAAGRRLRMEPTRAKAMRVRATDLTVKFGGVTALDTVSLEIEPGKVSGLIGPNGAGKTTFINAVTGFVDPTEGAVELDGRDISKWPVHRRARAGIGRSFQALELFEDLTVRENLQVAADDNDVFGYLSGVVRPGNPPLPPQVDLAIQEFELGADLEALPTELPFGRRRSVAIARAIASQPSVLLLDEPASGLDTVEREELADLIRRLADEWGLAILLVEHDVGLVMKACDQITVLDFGKPIASGPPGEVRENQAVIEAYLGEPEVARPAKDATGVPGEEPRR